MNDTETLTSIKHNSNQYSAIRLQLSGNLAALQKLISFNRNHGWTIKNGNTETFYCFGLKNESNADFLYFPQLKGITLKEVLKLPYKKSIPHLINLTDAFRTFKQLNISMSEIQLDAVIFTEKNEVIFLAPEIMKNIRDFSTNEYIMTNYTLINHPYEKQNESGLSYIIGLLSFYIITGEFPYNSDNEEDLFLKIRNLNITPPHLLVPGLKKHVSDSIMLSLGQSKKSADPFLLDDWKNTLLKWQEATLFEELLIQDEERIDLEKIKTEKKNEMIFNQRIFWEKNKKNFFTGTIFTVITVAIIWSIIAVITRPRLTKGFTPEMVVETFYKSMNRLDHTMMSDCVIKKAGKNEINMTTGLYLASSEVATSEGEGNVIAADEWDRQERKLVPEQKLLYGVIGLKLFPVRDIPEPVFRAEYEKWTPELYENSNSDKYYISRGYFIKELVYLTRDKNDWVIFQFKLQEQIPVKD